MSGPAVVFAGKAAKEKRYVANYIWSKFEVDSSEILLFGPEGSASLYPVTITFYKRPDRNEQKCRIFALILIAAPVSNQKEKSDADDGRFYA
jgi:hypothetical protein